MGKRLHIDPLLLFFVLALSVLVMSFGRSVLGIENNGSVELVRYLNAEDFLSYSNQIQHSEGDSIYTYNPDYDIFYSVDGGLHFQNGGSSIALNQIKNPDLKYIPSSFHWKRPTGKFPSSKNFIIRLKHRNRNIQTENIYLNYLEELHGDLPVLSMNLNIADLISEENGMLVFGKDSWNDEGFYKNWWNRSANFHRRGYESEHPVHLHYYEKNKLIFESQCGVKISGNATRGFPQKSFQLIARKNYGNEFLDYPFFGKNGNKKSRSLVVRNSGNDNAKTLFADLLMHTLAEESNLITQTGHPTVVYINGNYWGIYNLRERIDPYYLSKIEDVKEDEITILEGFELKDGDENEKTKFESIIDKLNSDSADPKELMKQLQDEIDMNSFTDYVIFETYYANKDWPSNNSICYKAKGGKWKWILHDLDYGLAYLGDNAVETNLFEKLDESNSVIGILFRFLIQNDEYKKQFAERVNQLLNSSLGEKNILSVFESLSKKYQNEIANQIGRWRMIKSTDEWEKNCQKNLDFLSNRAEIYRKQIESLK